MEINEGEDEKNGAQKKWGTHENITVFQATRVITEKYSYFC